MTRSVAASGMAAAMTVAVVLGAGTIPPALAAMADTERAFAKRAADTTIREAFIEFFADESIGFSPEPGPARERLRQQPDAFPVGMKLLWEPRVGDVAAGGDLGYLTGPTESTVPGQPTRYGTYFSVWQKQANGAYRVILDVGVGLPEKPAFVDGFVRSTAVATYRGGDTKTAAETGLMAADRAFCAAVAGKDAAAAYAATLHATGRVHRAGSQPTTTRQAAVEWMRANVKAMTSEPMKAETALSRDFGYTWGAYTMTPATGAASKGYYVRIWTRAADGRWLLAADVAQRSAK